MKSDKNIKLFKIESKIWISCISCWFINLSVLNILKKTFVTANRITWSKNLDFVACGWSPLLSSANVWNWNQSYSKHALLVNLKYRLRILNIASIQTIYLCCPYHLTHLHCIWRTDNCLQLRQKTIDLFLYRATIDLFLYRAIIDSSSLQIEFSRLFVDD